MTQNIDVEADQNLNNHLRLNRYPGRGIVIGLDQGGNNLIQIYWIMGRSATSRNRIFQAEGGRVYTNLADPSKNNGPVDLIIYNAMDEVMTKDRAACHFIVSNGVQTDHLSATLPEDNSMMEGLAHFSYEPDQPNFTPRISGRCTLHHLERKFLPIELAILRRPSYGFQCERLHYRYDGVPAGYGFCLTTYNGDGNPLPPFVGEPKLMSLKGTPDEIAQRYWDALNEENRVALVIKHINLAGESGLKIINRHQVGH